MKKFLIKKDYSSNTNSKKLHRVECIGWSKGYKMWGKINLALSEPQDINDLDNYLKELEKLGS